MNASELERVCLRDFILLPFKPKDEGETRQTLLIYEHAPGWLYPDKQTSFYENAKKGPFRTKSVWLGNSLTGMFYNAEIADKNLPYAMLELENYPGIYFSSVNFEPAPEPGSIEAVLGKKPGDTLYLLPNVLLPVYVQNGRGNVYRIVQPEASQREEMKKYDSMLEEGSPVRIAEILYGSDNFEGYIKAEHLTEEMRNKVTSILIRPEGFTLYFSHHNFSPWKKGAALTKDL